MKYRKSGRNYFLWTLTATSLAMRVSANGIYGNGVSADAMAMGGTEVAWASSPLSAMAANPAELGFLNTPELNIGGFGGLVQGNFDKTTPGNASQGSLSEALNGAGEGAFGFPLKKWPVTFGVSIIPDSALLANWHYRDPNGGLGGVSYGGQQDKSEISVLRSALGAGVQLNSKLSLGANIGLVYNENRLDMPYTFQNLHPASDTPYDGAKTLLNLHTTGFGWNVMAGLLFQATTNLQLGISYKSETIVNTSGDANGDPYAQFPPTPPGALAYHYDAQVKTKFPQEVSAGASWKFHPQWRAALQVDWIDWADAFNTLPVVLKNGNNATVNSVLGASFRDDIPLHWHDELVYRAGLEFDVTENFSLRAGYCYGHNPVSAATLTPLTAAILEHTITAGVGYRWRSVRFDLAYQYDLPVTQDVGISGLRSGEYSNSSTEVSAHVLALTTSIRF